MYTNTEEFHPTQEEAELIAANAEQTALRNFSVQDAGFAFGLVGSITHLLRRPVVQVPLLNTMLHALGIKKVETSLDDGVGGVELMTPADYQQN